jgi:hypothetical protein
MELEQVLNVLHGRVGTEIEVSAHGGGEMAPVSGVSARGRLRAGDVLSPPGKPEVFLSSSPGPRASRSAPSPSRPPRLAGQGWLDQKEEVLGVESGVVQLLITTAPEDEPGSLPMWPVR